MGLFSRRGAVHVPPALPVRFTGGTVRPLRGAEAVAARWAPGTVIEVALGTEEPRPGWPEAVAVYSGGRLLGWVNGGGEALRAALRETAARGHYVVVSGVVEASHAGPAVGLTLPSPQDVVGWLSEGAQVIDGVALPPVQVLATRDDGSVIHGRRLPRAEHLYAAGTPPVWGLAKHPEPSERVAAVRIGDALMVEEDEHGWTVADGSGVLGRLTWRRGDNGKPNAQGGAVIHYPARGRLVVTQVTETGGRVVGFGGVVTPA